MEEYFKNLAAQEGWEFKVEKQDYLGLSFSDLPVTTYFFKTMHNGVEIKSQYEFGNYNLAEFEAEIRDNINLNSFEITAKSHFWKLFNPQKSILKVDCVNSFLKNEIQKSLTRFKLEELANKRIFQPHITYKNYNLYTKFHLQFEDKETSLKPMMDFYKRIIDMY
jgi:hypothetical protein